MHAELEVVAVANGRAVEIGVAVPDYPVPEDEDDSGGWSWLARVRIGGRGFVAGAGTSIYEGATWGELNIGLASSSLPPWKGTLEVIVEVAIWHDGAWKAWAGRDLVECSGAVTIALAAVPPPPGAPFDSPQGPRERDGS